MTLNRRLLLAAAAALAGGPARAYQTDPLAALTDPAKPDGVLGLAVIARGPGGETTLRAAHGLGLAGGATRPFTLDTPMRVASISKLVAMTGLMTLVEAGRLSLDADASDLAGFDLRHPAHPGVRVTPAMLASHTGGLRNGVSYPVPLGRDLAEAFTPGGRHFDDGAWFAPASEPPGFFAYSDANFAVLAQIVERVSGERFDRFMTRTVLAPLGLDAGYNWSGVSDAARARASACCRLENGVWTPQVDAEVAPAPAVRILAAEDQPGLTADDYRIGQNGFVFSPQGGLRASVRDLDRLARFYAGHAPDPDLVSRETLRRMETPRWRDDGANGHTDRGMARAWGLSIHVPTGRAGDAFFGPGSEDWRGHFGIAYGLQSGLFWNTRDGRTISYIISGTPRDAEGLSGARSAASPWEEAIIQTAFG